MKLTGFLSVSLAVFLAMPALSIGQPALEQKDVDSQEPGVHGPGHEITLRDPIRWNAVFAGKKKADITVILDLGKLSRLMVVQDPRVTIGFYRHGKLLETRQFTLASGSALRGGTKYAKDFPVPVACDVIKPLRLDGSVEPKIMAK